MTDADERPLGEYLEDIRSIRETMLLAQDRLHVPAWFFFVIAAGVALGTMAHGVASLALGVGHRTILLTIWLPVGTIGGVAEAAAWIAKGRREGLPWLSRTFGRFIVTVAGTMTAIAVLAAMGLASGMSAAGLILVVGAATFLVYSPFCPVIAVWIGWALLAPGVGLLIAGVSGPLLVFVAAAFVTAGFIAVGCAELRSRRADG